MQQQNFTNHIRYYAPHHFIFLPLMFLLTVLGNQNRIVRLEFRLRYFELYGKDAGEAEAKLTFGQIAALRFADDAEFKALLEKTLQENLAPKVIKQSIRDWQGDYMRV